MELRKIMRSHRNKTELLPGAGLARGSSGCPPVSTGVARADRGGAGPFPSDLLGTGLSICPGEASSQQSCLSMKSLLQMSLRSGSQHWAVTLNICRASTLFTFPGFGWSIAAETSDRPGWRSFREATAHRYITHICCSSSSKLFRCSKT